ncbi:isocitrate lyase/PEP mutase family protein [Allosphingosinicella sp.]|jgi:2-methylisocitrate lyase-like PEP mutase family enzyme|uniref:isocitrate lyase/PEP mutase family protein n=1 Tax=Allosphingosinicella sp. TaxID=2823234 RepID=UPI002EE36C70
MTATWEDKAQAFAALHVPGDPLVLFNVWDAGSARIVAESGAKAIGTGSWSVAAAHGLADGEKLTLDLAIANAERIAAAVDLPVTVDLEGGYDDPAASASRARRAGAIGCNLEDRIVSGQGLYPPDRQGARLAAVRESAGPGFFINARIDLFLQAQTDTHDEAMVDEAMERGRAYASAGADGLFLPGLADERLIARAGAAAPLPVNIMVWPGTPPLKRLAELGVARISHAGAPWRLAMNALSEAARRAHAMED